MNDELVAWLTACLDQIELKARMAAEGGDSPVWTSTAEAGDGWGRFVVVRGSSGQGVSEPVSDVVASFGSHLDGGDQPADHVAIHDPRAVLTRVEAERAVLAEHPVDDYDGYFGEHEKHRGTACMTCSTLRQDDPCAENLGPCRTVRLLAYGHRYDTGGFRDEWKPDGA